MAQKKKEQGVRISINRNYLGGPFEGTKRGDVIDDPTREQLAAAETWDGVFLLPPEEEGKSNVEV